MHMINLNYAHVTFNFLRNTSTGENPLVYTELYPVNSPLWLKSSLSEIVRPLFRTKLSQLDEDLKTVSAWSKLKRLVNSRGENEH